MITINRFLAPSLGSDLTCSMTLPDLLKTFASLCMAHSDILHEGSAYLLQRLLHKAYCKLILGNADVF